MRLSLKLKIIGGFGLLLALIALLGWVTLSLFGSLRDVQRTVFDKALPRLVAVDEIVRSYTAQSAAVSGFLIRSDRKLLDQYEGEVILAGRAETRAKRLFAPGQERVLLDSLVEAGAEFQELVEDQVLPLALAGDRSQAFRVLGQEGSPLIDQIEGVGQTMRAAQDIEVVQTQRDIQESSNRVIVILLLVTVGALITGVVLAIVLPRRLVANLDKLVAAARGIGRSDFNQKIGITSRDEVGELAERFGEMQAGLKRLQQLAAHDRELAIAEGIQRNLLQREIPRGDSFGIAPVQRQANLVGGDWYDIELRGSELTFVIGDASGKGIGAALMSTVALTSLRAERGLGAWAQRLIEQANEVLREATAEDSFTTMIYATLDLEQGGARWLNMGHLAPFLLRSGGSGGFVEGPRNRVLGWFDDPGYSETEVRLEPGDRLVLFTDGFLEAKSPGGDLFGEDRLAEALVRLAPLPPEQMAHELIEEAERFAAGKIEDDLTMLVLDYSGSVGVG